MRKLRQVSTKSAPTGSASFSEPPATHIRTLNSSRSCLKVVETFRNTHLVVANGNRLYPYQNLTDLQTQKWGIPGFYVSGTTVYVHLTGDADPNGATMIVSRKNYALWVQQNFIYLLNLTFRHYGQGTKPRALYLKSGTDNLIQGCTFAINDTGIELRMDAHRNVIQDNRFHDTIFRWPWDSLYAGSGLADKGGIRFKASDPGFGTIPRGNIIRRNIFHDFFDGFGVCPGQDQGSGMTNETDVYENLVYNAGDDGMETDGDCSNVRIWGNTFHDVLAGVSLAPVRLGPVYAMRNLIYRTGVSGPGGATAFKFQHDNPGSGQMFLFHNTVAAPVLGGRGVSLVESAVWPLLVSRNNVWTGNDNYALAYKVDDLVDFDYDDLWRTTSWPLVTWRGTQYQSLADLCVATGQECHGLSVSPGFVNEAGGDYGLASSSQLVDTGVYIPGINDNYSGAAPDIGAFERESYGFSLSALPPTRVIAPGGTATYIVDTQPTGGFTSAVTLTVASQIVSLTVQLSPTALVPPAHAVLTITDNHSGTKLLPGLWHSIAITASGGGIMQQTTVSLLVGGSHIYLPLTIKNDAQ